MARQGIRASGGLLAPFSVAVLAAVLPAIAVLPAARADGAFPTAQSILLDATQPQHIILATNFGLVTSSDGGESWSYGCETPLSANAFQYSAVAPASTRIWALAGGSLVFSDDQGCSWTASRGGGGAWEGATVRDYFVDRGEPRRVLAIVSPKGNAGAFLAMSSDGGTNFAAIPLLSVDAAGSLDGVESAQGSGALYVVARSGPEHHWTLSVSRDLGLTWQFQDIQSPVEAHAGSGAIVTLAGIDRADDRRIYLRVRASSGGATTDGLAVTGDGGASLSFPLAVPGASFAAFLQRADGTLLLAGRDGAGHSLAYRSLDRGQSFAEWNVAPLRITGLAENSGTLFAATDNFTDKLALAVSQDGQQNGGQGGGSPWKGILSFDKISSVQGCLLSLCQSDCQKKAELGLFVPAVCTSTSGGTSSDAGTAPPAKSGCGCSSVPQEPPWQVTLCGASLALIFARRRRSYEDSRACGEEGDLDSRPTTV
jgi:hypothetical protein